MINKGFEIQTPLVKVEPDFVNLKVIPSGKNTPASKRKYRVIFKFKVYVNLFEALLQGITRFEMVVTEKDRFTIPFFTNPSNATPESVSNDVRAFFTKSKRALRVQAKRQEIYSKTYNIMDFADDRMISKISRGVVTLNNYERFLPTQDILRVANLKEILANQDNPLDVVTSLINTGSATDERTTRDLAYDVYNEYGYDPAMIAQVAFPSLSKESKISGVSNNSINPKFGSKIMPKQGDWRAKAPDEFYELYKRFLNVKTDSENLSYSIVEEPRKIKYKPIFLTGEIRMSGEDYAKFVQKNRLFLILKFMNGRSPVQTETFPWNNKKEFSKIAGIYKDLDISVFPGDFSIAESDKIVVRNRNKFAVRYTLYETHIRNASLVHRIIRSKIIDRMSTDRLDEASTIFGSNAQSRSYRIVCHRINISRSLPCGYNEITVPSSARRKDYNSYIPSIDVLTSDNGTAVVTIKNAPAETTLTKIYKKNVGPERQYGSAIGRSTTTLENPDIYVGSMVNNGVLTDKTGMYHNSSYLYFAEFYSNGALIPSQAETFVHYESLSEIARFINFNISKKSTQKFGKNLVKHSFFIEEQISPSVASSLLKDVTEIAQANNFSSELESIKEQTGTITSYMVFRINLKNNRRELLSVNAQPNTMVIYEVQGRINDPYKYIVVLNALPAAALSFKTVVTNIDQTTGREYKYLYKKWRGQVVKDEEALPSTKTITQDNINLAMALSKSGKKASTVFSSAQARPKIDNVNAEVDDFNKCNWITWSLRGFSADIDHFLIVASYNGIQAPVASAAPIRNKDNTYYISEKRLYGLLGRVTYQVIIVSKDYVYDDSAPEVSVTKLSTFPMFATI